MLRKVGNLRCGRRRQFNRRLSVERLEARIALSVLHGGHVPSLLVIDGTAEADQITISYNPAAEAVEVANQDGPLGTFSLYDWNSIQVNGGDGDDRITIDPALPLHVDVVGGDGTDTLVGIRLGEDLDVLFSSGEQLSFDNRSCLSIECILVEEGEFVDTESSTDPRDAALPDVVREFALVPPSSLMATHGHLGMLSFDMATPALGAYGEMGVSAGSMVANHSANPENGMTNGEMLHSFASGARRASPNSTHGKAESAAASSDQAEETQMGDTVAHVPAIGSSELDIFGDLNERVNDEESIDWLLAGWTDGGDLPAEPAVAMLTTTVSETKSVANSTHEQPMEQSIGVPDLAAATVQTLALPAQANSAESGSSTWTVAGSAVFAIVAAGGAYFLDRNGQRTLDSTRNPSARKLRILALARRFILALSGRNR
jgi:hypothetical protein